MRIRKWRHIPCMRPIWCPLAPVKEIFITDWSQMTNRVVNEASTTYIHCMYKNIHTGLDYLKIVQLYSIYILLVTIWNISTWSLFNLADFRLICNLLPLTVKAPLYIFQFDRRNCSVKTLINIQGSQITRVTAQGQIFASELNYQNLLQGNVLFWITHPTR